MTDQTKTSAKDLNYLNYICQEQNLIIQIVQCHRQMCIESEPVNSRLILGSVFRMRHKGRISRVTSNSSSRAKTTSQRTLSTSLNTKQSISSAWNQLLTLIGQDRREIRQTRSCEAFDSTRLPWCVCSFSLQMTPPGAQISCQTEIVNHRCLVRLDRQWF